MRAVIIKNEDYDTLPFILCDAIWEFSHKPYGFEMISRETKREIDKDTMVGMLLAVITNTLEVAGDKKEETK
jgi:abortive infection bacteriophage resistance protein